MPPDRCRCGIVSRVRRNPGLVWVPLIRYNGYVMSAIGSDDTPWELLEVIKRERRPVSDQFRNSADANAGEQALIGRQLRLLIVAGIPPDRSKGAPLLDAWFKWKDPDGHSWKVYVLKAKPSPWRFYCCVASASKRQIVFIHAVKKKETKRDPKDRKACEAVLHGLHSGKFGAAPLPVPGSRGGA